MAQPYPSKTGIYQFRRKVPEELRTALGREYKRSLHTRDPADAKRRFAEEWARSDEAFAMARAQLQGAQLLTERDMQQLAARWVVRELEKVEHAADFSPWLFETEPVGNGLGDVYYEEFTSWQSFRRALEEDPDTDLSNKVDTIIQEALRESGIPWPTEAQPLGRLRSAFHEHLLKLSDVAFARANGDWVARPEVLPLEPLTAERRSTKAKSKRLLELFEEYAAEKKLNDGDTRGVRKTVAAYRSVVEDFAELNGDLPVLDISRDVIRQYRAQLASMPSKGLGIRKLSVKERITEAADKKLQLASAPTIRNKLRAVSAVLSHGVRMGLLAENPVIASGVGKAAAKTASTRSAAANRRKDYSKEELVAIFTSPIYKDQGWSSPRADFGKAWYWLPLLMYYTGARREELAQLSAKDVAVASGRAMVPYLNILATSEDDGDDKGVKTQGSRRRIPLHRDLVERGFLEYARSVPQAGQLFPLLEPSPAGFYGANFGKRWASYLREVVQLHSSVSPSHGFRHTFKTLCREYGIAEDVHDAMTGHAGGNAVARDYGTMPLHRMALELGKYPTVDELLAPEPADIQSV